MRHADWRALTEMKVFVVYERSAGAACHRPAIGLSTPASPGCCVRRTPISHQSLLSRVQGVGSSTFQCDLSCVLSSIATPRVR